MDTNDKFMVVLLIFYGIISIGLVYECYNLSMKNWQLENAIKFGEQSKMMEPDEENLELLGFAKGDKWYCVWTADTKSSELYDTIAHEKLHILIAKNEKYLNTTYKEHFCK